MKQLSDIFVGFLRMSLGAAGGGYAMLPLLERWLAARGAGLSEGEWADLTTVAQASPGPFGLNLSVAVGHRLAGWRGACAAVAGVLLPPLVLFVALAALLEACAGVAWLARFVRGMQPALVALMVMPCYRLGRAAHISLTNVALPVGTILLVVAFRVSPLYVIAATAICAYLYGRFVRPQEEADGKGGRP